MYSINAAQTKTSRPYFYIINFIFNLFNIDNFEDIDLRKEGDASLIKRVEKFNIPRLLPSDSAAALHPSPSLVAPGDSSDIFISYCWANSKHAYKDRAVGATDPRAIAEYLPTCFHIKYKYYIFYH